MTQGTETISSKRLRAAAFTRSELVMVVGAAVLLLAICLPALGTRVTNRSARLICVNNLRQIGLAWRMSATSLNDKFPFQIPLFFSGEYSPEQEEAYQWYRVISNELRTPRILVCPNSSKSIAQDFTYFFGFNISYFIGVDTDLDLPRTLLGGDQNFYRVNAHFIDMPPSQADSFSWDGSTHGYKGNILQSDGAVQQYDNADLPNALRNSGGQNNRILRSQ